MWRWTHIITIQWRPRAGINIPGRYISLLPQASSHSTNTMIRHARPRCTAKVKASSITGVDTLASTRTGTIQPATLRWRLQLLEACSAASFRPPAPTAGFKLNHWALPHSEADPRGAPSVLNACTFFRTRQARFRCVTVQEAAWSGKQNGELLAAAELKFDVLITVDTNLRYQENMEGRNIAIVVLHLLPSQILRRTWTTFSGLEPAKPANEVPPGPIR